MRGANFTHLKSRRLSRCGWYPTQEWQSLVEFTCGPPGYGWSSYGPRHVSMDKESGNRKNLSCMQPIVLHDSG